MADTKKKWYDATQKLTANNTDKILVYDGTSSYTVNVSAIKGVDNVTDEYMLVTAKDGNQYRVGVDYLGNLYAIKDEAYTATPPSTSDNTNDNMRGLRRFFFGRWF